MSLRTGTVAPAGPSRLSSFAFPVLLGLCWLALEVACIAVRSPSFDAGETFRRMARLLPFHLALFVAFGVALACVPRRHLSSVERLGWWSVWGATLAFLGPRVALGVYRLERLPAAIEGLPGAVLAALATIAVISLSLMGFAALGRLLPGRLQPLWPWSIWAGWILFWVPFLRRAGPAIALHDPGEGGWLAMLDGREFALAAVGVVMVLALGLLRRPAPLVVGLAAALLAAQAPVRASEPARPDVLIILVDTLRADALRQAGGTPALDALAAESIHFVRAYSPSNNTRQSMPGVFTSLSFRVVGKRLPQDAVTLVEVLKDAGWQTHGVSANPWISEQYGYEQGFDALHDATNAPDFLVSPLLQIFGALAPGFSYHAGLVAADLYYRPGHEIRRRAIEILQRNDSPLMLYLHTMDLHGPYLPPKRFLDPAYAPGDFYSYFPFIHLDQSPLLETDRFRARITNMIQRYHGELRYSDVEIGELIQAYKAAGRWDETLVWLLADHGECFGEHGYTGHNDNLLEPLIHVPLMLKLPRSWGVPPREVRHPVSTFDVLPTTASLLGLEPPAVAFGVDLAPVIRGQAPAPGRTVVSSRLSGEYAAIEGPWKLRLIPDTGERVLHHLERDPGETDDLTERHPEIAARLEQAIRDRIRVEGEIQLEDEGTEIDAQMRRQLESLGYIE